MCELRVTHNMNIEDQNWILDDRLQGSTAKKLRGVAQFYDTPPIQLSTVLSRRASFLGESNFKDFRDYLKGTVTDFSVAGILQSMDKHSHFGSINTVILRNALECRKDGGGKSTRVQAAEQLEQLKVIMKKFILLASSKIGAYEKTVKTTLVKNMLLFEKFPEVIVN